MNTKSTLSALMLLGLSCLTSAAEPRSYETIKFDDFRLEPNKPQEFKFQQKDADNRQIRLVFEGRLDWEDLGGYTNGLVISVNGQTVHGARLLNKPLHYKTRCGGGNDWSGLEGGSWFLMYSPDFSDAIKTNEDYIYGLFEKDQEPYRFVLDLTGLTQHVGENTITFTHYMKSVFHNVYVEFDSEKQPRLNEPQKDFPAPTGPIPVCTPQGQTPSPVSIAVNDGKLVISAIGKSFELATRLSLPEGKFLDASYDNAQACTWTTPEYQLSRTIDVTDGRIQFTDTYTNLRSEVTGVIFQNQIALSEEPSKFLFHGIEVMIKEVTDPTNPTLVALLGNDCLAFVQEDDISRLQGFLSRYGNTIGNGDKHLGLPPNGKHTLKWSIYLLKDSDYFRFINRLRNDWDANYTVDGPFSFPYGAGSGKLPFDYWDNKAPIPENKVHEYLTKRPVKHIITHVTGDYIHADKDHPRLGHGVALKTPYYKWWQDSTRNMTTALKNYAPDVRVYAYLHKNLCAKVTGETYYEDSLAKDYTSVELMKNDPYLHRYIPTCNNSYGKELRETYRYLIDDIGTNIYMDEMCLGVTTWQKFPEWDNCTVEIDSTTHKVKNTITIPTLLVRDFLTEMMQYIKSKGRRLIANAAPAFGDLNKFKAIHFTEECMGTYGLYSLHLTTPVSFCYGDGKPGYQHYLESMKGGLPCFIHSGDFSSHTFPMTPIEIHAGYLICQERIITTVSGTFGWNDAADAEFYVYDREGNLTKEYQPIRKLQDGIATFEVRIPSEYLVIIVKKN